VAVRLSRRRAEELEREALATGQPTPRAAAEVLISDDIAELERLEADADRAKRRALERMVRQNYKLDADGRGLPDRHPDRIGLRELGELIHRDAMNASRWMERYLDKLGGQPPRYKPTDSAPAP
jgi:exonuclease VII large subunit